MGTMGWVGWVDAESLITLINPGSTGRLIGK
jgi:hypothetical protein